MNNLTSADNVTSARRGYGFALGLVTGSVVGVGLALWLAPRSAKEIRRRLTDSARSLGEQAAEGYEQASARVGEAVSTLVSTGNGVRNDVATAVARGAHEVERLAVAAKSGR
jgi:gas vesicle protein